MNAPRTRNILITGGNSGMGKAIAEAFVRKEDARVAIIGRDEEKLNATATELGPHLSCYQADVSQRDQVAATVTEIVQR
ncbi:MAG: SDR family NAD(P)-dependent oxidoreductase, partial [Ktedonobacteraceae bacterium]|nr:SDR family NAD(P)-dependent oxidoreductase [Ktedonobacteraceae bacterium]